MPIVARFITKAFVKSSQINLLLPLSDSDVIYGRPLRVHHGVKDFVCDDWRRGVQKMCDVIYGRAKFPLIIAV